MAKRSKDDKKRAKKKLACRNRREYRNKKKNSFFKVINRIGDNVFPYDMLQEINKVVSYSMSIHTSKEWRLLSEKPMFIGHIDNLIKRSVDHQAFSKYFPRYSIGHVIKDGHCYSRPFKTKRVFLANQVCYLAPVKLPLCGGHDIVFSKHAMERLVQRYGEFVTGMSLSAPQISLFYPLILKDMNDYDFEITYIRDKPHLHSYGKRNKEMEYGRGQFPIIIKEGVAVAKTFLYDEWLDYNIEN